MCGPVPCSKALFLFDMPFLSFLFFSFPFKGVRARCVIRDDRLGRLIWVF